MLVVHCDWRAARLSHARGSFQDSTSAESNHKCSSREWSCWSFLKPHCHQCELHLGYCSCSFQPSRRTRVAVLVCSRRGATIIPWSNAFWRWGSEDGFVCTVESNLVVPRQPPKATGTDVSWCCSCVHFVVPLVPPLTILIGDWSENDIIRHSSLGRRASSVIPWILLLSSDWLCCIRSMHCDLKKSRRNEKVEKKDSLAYSSSWTYGIPQLDIWYPTSNDDSFQSHQLLNHGG